MQRLLRHIPERVKEPLRHVIGKEQPYGLSQSSRRRLKKLSRFSPTVVTLFGRKLTLVDAASFLCSHHEVFEREIYRFSSVNRPFVIIDAGANIGLVSIYFHLRCPGAHIKAIESDPSICAILRKNLSTFDVANAEIIEGAVWDRNETVRFAPDHADSGRVSDNGEIVVQGIRLRRLIEGRHIDLLKMDIEGAETRVLQDCENALAGVQRIFVEYHSVVGQPQNLSVLLGIFERCGFHYTIHHTGVFNSQPLVKQHELEGFDMQLNISAVRREVL